MYSDYGMFMHGIWEDVVRIDNADVFADAGDVYGENICFTCTSDVLDCNIR